MSDGPDPGALIAALDDARRRFLALVEQIRPDLHRYCARMTGSIVDGEDVVQETLAHAYYHLSELRELPPLKPWLFRIGHNRAIDALRRGAYRASEPLEAAMDVADDAALEPESTLARRQAVGAAVVSFLRLPPAQRACVILKDVLDHTLEEIAAQLELSVPAVKAALHRGRTGLRDAGDVPAQPAPAVSDALRRYASLFNAHEWDGVRALLADDVRLDLVSRRRLAGKAEVELYFGNYERLPQWQAAPGWLDGREVIEVVEQGGAARRYFIELRWRDGRVEAIKDLRYVGYIAQGAAFVPEGLAS